MRGGVSKEFGPAALITTPPAHGFQHQGGMKALSTSTTVGKAPQHNSRPGRAAGKRRKLPEPVHGQTRRLVPMHVESN
jgi:hypothetical protein